MQRWSKFQYQSRDLEKKLLFILFTIGLISFSPQVFAQQDLGMPIEQQKIIFEVGRHSDIHVKHVIETGKWNSSNPRVIEIIPGTHSNLQVTDEDGDRLASDYDGETFEESSYIILKQKQGEYDLIVEYDLDDAMKLENDIWKIDLRFQHDVIVMFEDDINLIFSNSRPIMMQDAKGINCMGCNMTLEFFDDNEIFVEKLLGTEKEYEISYLSNGEIKQMQLNNELKIISFEVSDDQLIIMKIPFELILNPFEVYFTEKEDTSLDQIDKIRKTEINQEDTHSTVAFRTSDEGVVSITGATMEQHQKKIEQNKKIEQSEKASPVIPERESGIALPLPGQVNSESDSEQNNIVNENKLSFAEELETDEKVNLENDSIVIGVILAIIAAVIIGIIVKIKKN